MKAESAERRASWVACLVAQCANVQLNVLGLFLKSLVNDYYERFRHAIESRPNPFLMPTGSEKSLHGLVTMRPL
ncbi:hypothetical protein M378DRAFT_165881 [Amanita muscaria Koide BX008]|uniref:Uncharacterized protein n=1 Tax=Amanita muscaria (strain Koide BX008) TaxID=946122 RepID=A0A0C2WL94_AMAMK|nr:hypothetical protein M378DRAFT_165881 [Amanita muscaria Koide BX008]